MATKITWEDKEGIQNDTSIARKNKVVDDDMNEIKKTVNNNADELIEAQENIEDLQGGQDTAGADIKNLRSRVSILETENTTNKSDISSLKSDNTTNKENISTLQEQVSNKVDKVEGKGLSTNDYTTEEKQKLAGLKNYDDTEIKQDISDIKKEQQTQNKNIEQNTTKNKEQDELISKLKSALINVETEEAKSLHIEDASEVPAQLKVMGNQEQDGEPSPENEVEVKCLGSNKNLFDEDNYIENLTINTDGTFKDDSSFKIIKIPVKSNTVYTLSRSAVEESTANIVYGTSDVEPSANATCTYKILHYNITEIQIETTENTKYICIRKTKANTDYRLFVDFKIEEGDTATSYSPYRTR